MEERKKNLIKLFNKLLEVKYTISYESVRQIERYEDGRECPIDIEISFEEKGISVSIFSSRRHEDDESTLITNNLEDSLDFIICNEDMYKEVINELNKSIKYVIDREKEPEISYQLILYYENNKKRKYAYEKCRFFYFAEKYFFAENHSIILSLIVPEDTNRADHIREIIKYLMNMENYQPKSIKTLVLSEAILIASK